VEVRRTPPEMADELRREAAEGLASSPKRLSAKWHYDQRGSELFEQITALPEYYPTRRERQILEMHAPEIARAAEADTLIELGSGFSQKTRLLLDAMQREGRLTDFVPVDVSEDALRASAERIAEDYPALRIHGVVGDFQRDLDNLPGGSRRMIAFLGSTIGNLPPADRAELLDGVSASLAPDETFLLGTDLVKDPERLRQAYDDPGGVTAAFSKNVLAVLNRDLGADFDLDRFRHDAVWDEGEEWMDLGLISVCRQTVHVPALGMTVRFEQGEKLHTEISAKFRRQGVEHELTAAGLRLRRWWTDPAGDFALSLAVRS